MSDETGARKYPLKSWAGAAMILVGLLAVAFSLSRGLADYQRYNSPFDEIDHTAAEVGLIPALSYEENSEAARAPTLAAAAQDGAEGPQTAESPPEAAGATSGQEDPESVVYTPEWLVIPSIDVRAPVLPAEVKEIEYKGETFSQWTAPDTYAAGWHSTSAPLGQPGNTVLNGHHNVFGEVFRDLYTLEQGELIYVYSQGEKFTYEINLVTRLNERFQPVEVRLENARWISPSTDERLTLISCWPYESNTHRIVVVAVPVAVEPQGEEEGGPQGTAPADIDSLP